MLEAIALTKDFGTHRALDTLHLRVEPGEILCLLGANGAGKTTTINLFLGFLSPTSGSARVDDIDVQADPVGTKRRLLYVPEQISLFGELTGLENLDYFAALADIEDRSPARLRECLTAAGLPPAAFDRRAAGYSKGMRQKLASHSRSRRAPAPCCSTNRLRDLTPKPPPSSTNFSCASATQVRRCSWSPTTCFAPAK